MKITLLTSASEYYLSILKHSAPNKMEYCLKWNINLSIKRHEKNCNLNIDRNQIMRDSIQGSDWLWFMGADTLIMNQNIDVRSLLDEDYDLIIAEDVNGLNNDVFFLKNNQNGNEFLNRTLLNIPLCAHDQDAMVKSISELPHLKVKVCQQRQFNSYLYSEYRYPSDKGGSFQLGDFILHFPGIPNPRRNVLMPEYLNKVIK